MPSNRPIFPRISLVFLTQRRKDAETQRESLCLSLSFASSRLCAFVLKKQKDINLLYYLIFLFFLLLPFTSSCTPFGKDAELVFFQSETPEYCPCPTASGPGVSLSRLLIRFHQEVITQIDGPRSHFRPSSSQYTLDAIEKYGFLTGWILGCDRLLRENDDPWIYPKRLNENDELYKWDPVR